MSRRPKRTRQQKAQLEAQKNHKQERQVFTVVALSTVLLLVVLFFVFQSSF